MSFKSHTKHIEWKQIGNKYLHQSILHIILNPSMLKFEACEVLIGDFEERKTT